MILSQRYQPKESVQTISARTTNNHDDSSEETDALLSDDGPMQESSVEIEDLILPTSGTRSCGGTGRYRCDSEHRQYCSGLIRRYEVPPAEEALSPTNVLNTNSDETCNQQLRHTLLLLLLCISMFVGAALCIWTLFMDQFSGIYVELVFFDGFLNLGQAIFTFALFGINLKAIVKEISRHARKVI